MTDFTALSVRQLVRGYAAGDFTARQVTESYLDAKMCIRDRSSAGQ